MSLDYRSRCVLSTRACVTLLVAGVHYYLRTRQDALSRRIQELQEQSMAAGSLPLLGGDFWDSLLRSTYGVVLGKGWFRQKELELMRAGFRGPKVVKVYGMLSFLFTLGLLVIALTTLQDQDLLMWLLGLAGALVLGYFIPEQILVF